jgi:hypothetical protein
LIKKHSATSSNVPKTFTQEHSAKKQKPCNTPTSMGAAAALENLTSSIENFSRNTNGNDQLHDLQELSRSDETSLLQHRHEFVDLADKFADVHEQLENGIISEENFRYRARKNAYDACEKQIGILESRIEQTNNDIKAIKFELHHSFVTPKKKTFEESVELDLERSTNNDEEDNYGSMTYPSDDEEDYDGHMDVDANRSLEDNEIGMCEDFD